MSPHAQVPPPNATVLVLEDNAGRGGLVAEALREAGFACSVALDVDDLLHRHHRERAEAIVIDGEGAGCDTVEAMSRIAATLTAGQMLPVLIVDDAGTSAKRHAAREAGVTTFLPRGLEAPEIAARVAAWIDSKRTHDALMDAKGQLSASADRFRLLAEQFVSTQAPSPEGWNVQVRTLPGGRFGADCCDVYRATSGKLLIAVGEISGDPPGCLLALASARAVLRTAADSGIGLPEALASANRRVLEHGSPAGILSLYVALFDPAAGAGEHLRAGVPDPILNLPETGDWAPAGLPTGLPLGVDETPSWEASPLLLQPGAQLAAATNGIDSALGENALATSLAALPVDGLEEAADFIEEQLEMAAPLGDDATFVLIERAAPAG